MFIALQVEKPIDVWKDINQWIANQGINLVISSILTP